MSAKSAHIDLTPPGPGEVVLPLPPRVTPLRWAVRAGVTVLLIAAIPLLFHYDKALMDWRHTAMPLDLHGFAKQFWEFFRQVGQAPLIALAVVIVFRMDRRRKFIIAAILLAQLIAAAGYNGGKYTIARYRPYAAYEELSPNFTAKDTWIGWEPDIRRPEKYRSFPSGHSAGSFAFAMVMAWFYPRLKYTFWTLAVGCALSRWVDVVHWPSDCLVGSLIGYTSAWMALRPYAWVLPIYWYRNAFKHRRAKAKREQRSAMKPNDSPAMGP